MSEFRITFERSGVLYSPHYADSPQSAIRQARIHGFGTYGVVMGSLGTAPVAAQIQRRVSGHGRDTKWETVAHVNADGVTVVPFAELGTTKDRESTIAELQAGLDSKRVRHEVFARFMPRELVPVKEGRAR